MGNEKKTDCEFFFWEIQEKTVKKGNAQNMTECKS